ncbi:X-box Hypothetical protein protein 1 [Nesidiocoris tenuis]|uniref:X-box-binding protein 1 n=1 Tax=Nesidiocoris tenuis TaxID=355587 RepID=A0ABN7B0S7_9HEMI|nr:X-box Hypothetical protein protein 1 [Nesidiocoris tenuis]
MVVTKFCRPRLLIKQEKDQIREMMIASAKNYTYTISLAAEDMDIKLEPEAAVAPPRKRRRLDYLSPEEKARRKKLKNREAAQTSRDKKKAYVTRLEETIKALRDENQRLALQMIEMAEQKDELARTNASLREELKAATSDRSSTARPAAPAGFPLQKERHFKWLDELAESAVDLEELGRMADSLSEEGRKIKIEEEAQTAELVGPQPKSLESDREVVVGEPASYDVKDEYIIITVPADDSDIISDCEEIVCTDDDVEIITEDDSLSCSSPLLSSGGSPAAVDYDTDYFQANSTSESDLGYDSLDSPDSNHHLKMLFPALL